jgi:hypothetical protein
MAIGVNRTESFKDKQKGDSSPSPPLISRFVRAQKLNVMPVVAALMVAPPIVLLN